MTTDELERDLRLLAEPREGDERMRDETRARLGELTRVEPKRHRKPAIGWAAACAAGIAAAVIAVVGLGGSTGASSADAAIIRHALRAIALPANVIVHVKETGVQNGTRVGVEWWQQTDPPHSLRMIKSFGEIHIEAANNGTTAFEYDARTNTVVETPAASAPVLVDPIAGVRRQLASGDAHVLGTTTIDGVPMYKIKLPTGVVGYFDTTNYRPMYLDNPQTNGTFVRTRVVAYQELPMTSDTTKLLSIAAQHPGARVETRQAPSK